jgi:poly(A) polymerase
MATGWWRLRPVTDRAARPWLYRLKRGAFTDRVLLAWSRSRAPADDPAWHELLGLPERWPVPVFPLRASHFLALGLPKGPPLGAALRAAEEAWIDADFPVDKTELAEIAVRAAARAQD